MEDGLRSVREGRWNECEKQKRELIAREVRWNWCEK
jgi:hypothetical protein